jgi:outer membrane receptor protein involved in Fe transport
MKLIQFLFAVILLTSCFITSGQSSFKGGIKGRIIETESHEPVEFATASLFKTIDSSLVKGAVTNKQGQFSFSQIQGGKYYIQINCLGYETLNISNVTLSNNMPILDLGIKEIKLSNILLEDVKVIGGKSVLNTSIDRKIYNVDKDILSQSGSVSDILQNIPSVTVDIDGQVSLRGSSNITFFINGKPSTMLNKNSAMVLQQLSASNLERIEVITNPSAKYKPEGFGGIINIVLKKEKQKGFNGSVLASAGNDSRYNANLSLNYNTGKLNIFGSYGFRRNNSPRISSDYRISKDSSLQIINFYNSNSNSLSKPISHMGYVGVEYQINEQNKIEFTTNADFQYMKRTQLTNTSWEDSQEKLTSEYSTERINKETDNEWETNLVFEHQFKEEDHTLQFEFNLSGYDETENNLYTENHSFPSVQKDFSWIVLSKGGPKTELYAEYTLPINEETEFEAGYVLEVFRDDLFYLGEYFDKNLNKWQKDYDKSNDFIFHQQVHALYSTFAHSFDRLSFLAGLRMEQVYITSNLITLDSIVLNNYFKIYPTLHLSYEIDDKQELQLNYSKRVRRPDSDEMNPFPEYSDPRNIESGNPLIKPEQSHSLEFGYHLKGDHFSFVPSIYYRYKYDAFTEIKSYINDTVLLSSFVNLSKSQSTGIELIMSANIKNKVKLNWSMDGYYSSLDAASLGYSENKESYSWSSKLGLNIDLSESTVFQLNSYYYSKRITTQGSIDPSFYVNLGFRQDLFHSNASILFTISDLFNSLNRVSYIDTPELFQKSVRKRNAQIIYLGFTYRFGENAKKETQDLKFDDAI